MASFIACMIGKDKRYALEVDLGARWWVMIMVWKKRGWKSAETGMFVYCLLRHTDETQSCRRRRVRKEGRTRGEEMTPATLHLAQGCRGYTRRSNLRNISMSKVT